MTNFSACGVALGQVGVETTPLLSTFNLQPSTKKGRLLAQTPFGETMY